MPNVKYIALFLLTTTVYAQSPGTFRQVANYTGLGSVIANTVGPGPVSGSERFYASVIYFEGALDVLSIDPDNGNTQVFHSPVPLEEGAYGMTAGPGGNIYLGTAANAHLLKLDPKRGTFVDLGRPSRTEEWIWDLAIGSDNRLYGVTYPNCKLVRYDPETGQLADLGRLDPSQQYARHIAASKDGFIYAGIGSSKTNITAYEIRTGKRMEILPEDAQLSGFANVYRGADGNIYGAVGKRQFRLNQWTATELESAPSATPAMQGTLHDGRNLSISNDQGKYTLHVSDSRLQTTVQREIKYQGQQLSLFRIGLGPDGAIYGSSALPGNLVRADLNRHTFEEVGQVGAGEVYSFLNHGNRLLLGAYSALSTLMSYQPGQSFSPAARSGNPLLISFRGGGSNTAWRPMALIDGPDGKVYMGALAIYGQLGSPLIEWDTESGAVQRNDDVVHEQCVLSLASWHRLIVGGTTIKGGPGSQPTQREATLFVWNPITHLKEFEIAPVAGATDITDLVAAPNDLVYGIAGTTLFEFNPSTRKISRTLALPFSRPMQPPDPLYNSVAVDASGIIWGLTREGIFAIDTKTFKARLAAQSPVPITGGFAFHNGAIYFISGSAVYSYMP